jgi:genome maintenance exonuclease 1
MAITHAFVETPTLEQVTAEDGTRYYALPDGTRFESVTTFIGRQWDKGFLEKWAKRIGETKAASESARTANRGKLMHSAVETYLLNDEVAHRKILSQHVLTKGLFLKVKPELNKLSNIRVLEKPLYSRELKLAGTPDIIADYDGVLSVVDNKTSTRDKLEKWITTYWLQTAIYGRMYQELYGELPAQSVILMAVEDNPRPLIFIESAYKGQQRLEDFLQDPAAFQERLNNVK